MLFVFSCTVNPLSDAPKDPNQSPDVYPGAGSPIFSLIGTQNVKTDTSLTINYILTDANDVLDCTSSISINSSDSNVLPVSDITPSGSGTSCVLTVTPTNNLAGSVDITLTATDGTNTTTTTFSINVIALTGVVIDPDNLVIAVGGTSQLQLLASYSDLSTANVATHAQSTWNSAAPARVTVNNGLSKGLVTGVSSGTAVITGSYRGFSDTTTVTSNTVTGISLSQASVSRGLGSQISILATAQTLVSSFDITNSAVWTTSDAAIATVQNGVIQFLSVGAATVTATYGVYTATVQVTVLNKSLVSLSIALVGGGTSMPINAMKSMILTGTYTDASTDNLTTTAQWMSSNTTIATVSNTAPRQGRLRSLSAGTTVITAQVGGLSTTLNLNVNNVNLVSIAVTPYDSLVASNSTYSLTATGTYTDGATGELTELVTWTSSNTTAATISNAMGSEGLLTTQNFAGYRSTTINATLAGITGTSPLGVNGTSISSIVVSPDVTLAPAGTYSLKAYANLSDGGVIDVTSFSVWSTSDVTKVSVSNAAGTKGVVNGVATGTASITASYSGFSGARTIAVAASEVLNEMGIGLLGEYYNFSGTPSFDLANKKGSRIDQKINFSWASGNAPMGVGDNFTVRWTGFYKATSTSNYFCTYTDDGVRVWINGAIAIDNWTDHGPTWNCTGLLSLTVGTKYAVRVEYYEKSGGSQMHLTRSSVSAADAQNTSTRSVPQQDLYPN